MPGSVDTRLSSKEAFWDETVECHVSRDGEVRYQFAEVW